MWGTKITDSITGFSPTLSSLLDVLLQDLGADEVVFLLGHVFYQNRNMYYDGVSIVCSFSLFLCVLTLYTAEPSMEYFENVL